MKLLDLMKKYLAPSVLGAITIDNYKKEVLNYNKDLTELQNMNKEQLIELQKQLWNEKSVNLDFRVILESSSSKIEELESEIFKVKSSLNNIELQINSKNFNIGENIESLNNKHKYCSEELSNLINKKDSCINELIEKINNNVNKSDIFNFISDMVEKYQSIISNLNLEQLVALFNIFGFIMVLITIVNISTVLIGDYLIDKLNLENNFPKLSKYIRIKQNLNKGYLIFYIVLLYILTIIYILCNIYMLILKYFI
jgi:hypothetical protein|uniref:LAGLIDADG endonuclease n=1 Tax=Amanita muscaria TaxID=41956 RepID=A0A5Q0N2M1_AMAMU|nr:hypothetical protein [Amanita muscaria]QFZ98628.1 hypothetical protein [Amanita muscaria]